MSHTEEVLALRADTQVHYNCCQSVLLPFASEMGLSREQAVALGSHFHSGMLHGSVCGALSGAIMVLGALGYDQGQASEIVRKFRSAHDSTSCAELLKSAHDRGQDRKEHCDGLVLEMVRLLDGVVGEGRP